MSLLLGLSLGSVSFPSEGSSIFLFLEGKGLTAIILWASWGRGLGLSTFSILTFPSSPPICSMGLLHQSEPDVAQLKDLPQRIRCPSSGMSTQLHKVREGIDPRLSLSVYVHATPTLCRALTVPATGWSSISAQTLYLGGSDFVLAKTTKHPSICFYLKSNIQFLNGC